MVKILIIANHYPVCSARYMVAAFRRLGHEVRHIGPPKGRLIWGLELPAEYEWQPNDATYTGGGRSPDLTVVMDSDPYVLNASARRAEASNETTVVYGVDNHVRDYRRPPFAHYFLAHRDGPVQPVEHDDESWLPCAFDPVAFSETVIPFEARQHDIAMIGVMYPERWELVRALRASGYSVIAGSGLVYGAYRDVYHNARVALVKSFNGDLPIRFFEGAGMGCFVITDPPRDFLDSHENPLHLAGFGVYRDTDELLRRLPHWLNKPPVENPELEQVKAAQATLTAQVRKHHTWDTRAQTIIDWMKGTQDEPKTVP